MTVSGYVANLSMAAVMFVGGYQFYFFVQRRHFREPIEFDMFIDKLIPFRPGWVWVYSGLYYPVILSLVFITGSFTQFNYISLSFIILLAMQLCLFLIFPVRTPARWRKYNHAESLSTRFLAFVQSFDGLPNCFPSMHVSMSMLAALHLFGRLTHIVGDYAFACFLFPVLIGASTVFTKQHYLADLLPGILLGFMSYETFEYYSHS